MPASFIEPERSGEELKSKGRIERGKQWGSEVLTQRKGHLSYKTSPEQPACGRGVLISSFLQRFTGGQGQIIFLKAEQRLTISPTIEFAWWLRWWRIRLQCRRLGFHPWVGKIPWRREWQPIPVFLPGKFHGQRSLAGYRPWSRRVRHNWVTYTHIQSNSQAEGQGPLRQAIRYCYHINGKQTLTIV